tara:strand:+ start:837 stop:1676 length:840 start_codon:yes stop_codon:yes gene_type:complete
MGPQKMDVDPVGAVVYWGVGETDRDELGRELGHIGLGKFLPGQRTPDSALFNALKDSVPERGITRDYLIQSHRNRGDNGYEVVEVHKEEQNNGYEALFSARVKDDKITFSEGLWDYATIDASGVQGSYDHFRQVITGSSMGSCLVDICQHLRGTSLRPSGGIYWLPEDAVSLWDEVGLAVSRSAVDESSVYRLRTVMDERAAEAVIDAITSEVDAQSAEILDGIGELGERALRTREERSRVLKAKVEHYEQMLGEGLDKLKSVCDIATKSAAHAVLAQL